MKTKIPIKDHVQPSATQVPTQWNPCGNFSPKSITCVSSLLSLRLTFVVAALLFLESLGAYGKIPYVDTSGDKGSPSPSPSPSCSPSNTTNPIKVFSGNVNRQIIDLEIWGGIGEHQLQFSRFGNSRTDRDASFKTPFGSAHNWSHNYEYVMADEGLNEFGQAQLEVTFPDGTTNLFTQDVTDSSLWLPEVHVGKRLFQSGNTFTLQMENGWRYDFEKLDDGNGGFFYQLQDFRDSQQNVYSFTYDPHRRFTKITEPAGRFFQVAYSIVGGQPVISTVTTSDGRSVTYGYTVVNDGVTSWVELTSATYGDGTQALYTYSQTQPGDHPLLEHAIDPRYPGPYVNMKYVYTIQDGQEGFVKQELNGVTGEVMVTLTVSGPDYTLVFANGANRVSNMPKSQRGLVNFETDGLGRTTSYQYADGGAGFLIGMKDALRRVTRYTRTIYGNPLTVTKPDNSQDIWTRDDLDLPLSHTDEPGRQTIYSRDANHRIIRIDYPDGTFETFTYNDFGEVLDHQRRNGGVEHNLYDARGLKTSFQDAEGNITQYTYDSADRLACIIDARGNPTCFEYNERGLLIKKTNADTTYQTFEYDAFGNQTKRTDELGHMWTRAYDEFRRVVDATDPLGRVIHYDYDLPGGICGCTHSDDKPTKITLPSGRMTTMEYDVEWQLLSRTVGAGSTDEATTHYDYDDVGNQTTMTDPRGFVWTTEYDVRNRKHAFTDPLGNRTWFDHDPVGNIVKVTRPDGGRTRNEFDSMNRLIRTTDPKNETTRMAYDSEDNMINLTDARGNQYQYTYDLLNRKLSLIYPDSSHEDWSWDAVSNLNTSRTRAGQTRTYAYDVRNRETDSSWDDGVTPAISRSYDDASRLLTMNSSVSALTYTYTDANELASETQAITGSGSPKTIQYAYNLDGLRDTLTYPDGTVVTYTYTGRNQVDTISDGGSMDPLANYDYDLSSNRIGKSLENGTTTDYMYDEANRMKHIAHQKGSGVFASFDYVYDSVDRRTSVTHEDASVDLFGYDPIDQVTSVDYGADNRSVSYLYDQVGNRRSVTDNGMTTKYKVNDLNEYIRVDGDFVGYDVNGNLMTSSGRTYIYDAQNRLLSATNGTTIAIFAYDPRNRRVRQTINGVDTLFYFDIWMLIDERGASDVQQARYVNGAMLDEMLSKTSSGVAVYYHYDSIGSAAQLTDSSGSVAEKYSYDVFGAPTIRDANGNVIGSTAFGNRFLFAGREFLSQIDLYDYRHRFYSQELGRFLQVDPVGFEAGDVNIYDYVFNNPVNWKDAYGLREDPCIPWHPPCALPEEPPKPAGIDDLTPAGKRLRQRERYKHLNPEDQRDPRIPIPEKAEGATATAGSRG